MRIISRRRLAKFWGDQPRARPPLTHWYAAVKAAKWRSFAELRKTFGHADLVKVESGNMVTVFNVGGNNFRLVCAVHYNRETVYVLRIMTHAEYDKGKWKEDL